MSRGNYGPCMCGATDCPSCGPAQGYEVVQVWSPRLNRYIWVNPEDQEEAEDEHDNLDRSDDGYKPDRA